MYSIKKLLALILISLFIMLSAIAVSASDTAVSAGQSNKEGLTFDFDSRSYFYNLEYMGIPQREGETWFGDNLRLLLQKKQNKGITYTVGLYVASLFGEDQFFYPFAPVLTFNFAPSDDFYFTIGTLDRRKHALMDALFDETLEYSRVVSDWADRFRSVPLSNFVEYPRPLDNGVDIYFAYLKPLTLQLWGNWQYLNEVFDSSNFNAHTDNYDVGAIVLADFKSTVGIVLNGQWHYIHRYGVLNNQAVIQGDHAFDAGLSYIPSFIPKTMISANFLASIAQVYNTTQELLGTGQEFKLDYDLYGWKLFTIYWMGQDFYAEDGNPLYQAVDFWNFGFTKNIDIIDGVNIAFGLTIYYINNKFTHSEKVYINFDKIFNLL